MRHSHGSMRHTTVSVNASIIKEMMGALHVKTFVISCGTKLSEFGALAKAFADAITAINPGNGQRLEAELADMREQYAEYTSPTDYYRKCRRSKLIIKLVRFSAPTGFVDVILCFAPDLSQSDAQECDDMCEVLRNGYDAMVAYAFRANPLMLAPLSAGVFAGPHLGKVIQTCKDALMANTDEVFKMVCLFSYAEVKAWNADGEHNICMHDPSVGRS
jgi:hypothetical protein